MADRTKQRFSQQGLDSLTDFDDQELRATMQEPLKRKKANTNIWNVATIAGIAMFFVGMLNRLNRCWVLGWVPIYPG
ncbi:MAG: hypothetical protein U5K69_19260 [Balneolaceae bacterium]|nr:hypothetical protein [Balneolaceae bacterium]